MKDEAKDDMEAERALLDRALGGWRGLIDSALPTVAFLTVYVLNDSQLAPALIVALGLGIGVAGWRILRREPLQQVFAGLVGLFIAAAFAQWTGRAEDFFLPGLITNIAYGTAFLVSILIGWPLLGVAMGFLTSQGTTWRRDAKLRRTYAAATWIWVGLFFLRVAVQGPLYLSGNIAALGTVKIVMGWPLFLGCAYLTYRLLRPILQERRKENEAEAETPDQ
jgi:Protein of unknown function (DUF3159)